MSNIQVDTKSLKLAIYHQFNNIKLSIFSSHIKQSFPLSAFNRCCTDISYSRVPNILSCFGLGFLYDVTYHRID